MKPESLAENCVEAVLLGDAIMKALRDMTDGQQGTKGCSWRRASIAESKRGVENERGSARDAEFCFL